MTDNTIFTDWTSWQFDQEQDALYWADRWAEEALKQKTYGQALAYLDKQKPKIPDNFVGSTEQVFINWNREIFEDAKQKVYKAMKGAKIDHDRED